MSGGKLGSRSRLVSEFSVSLLLARCSIEDRINGILTKRATVANTKISVFRDVHCFRPETKSTSKYPTPAIAMVLRDTVRIWANKPPT
jgi:hypothetical protein